MSSTAPQKLHTANGLSMWLTISAATLTLLLGLQGSLGIPPSQTVLLSFTLIIAALFSCYEGRIPLTGVRLSPTHILVFWGILNTGLIGGLLVAAAAVSAAFSTERLRRSEWFKIAVVELLSAAAAGSAFGAAFSYTKISGVQLDGLIPIEVLAASGAMLFSHFLVWSALTRVLSSAPFRSTFAARTVSLIGRGAVGAGAAALGALLLFAAFAHFGYEFGLVAVPLAVLGNVFYRVHLRRLSQKTHEIVEASRLHLATVEALATAIDARDQVGVGHLRRTQIYAVGIGTSLGLDDDELNALRAGALLHDIGKLAVPEHILNKPGRLTSAELEKTKIHAEVGASILKKVGFPYPVVPAVRHHHECWDGSGYPDGLRGESIPVTARILAVADAYDALRGARPYRTAVSREDAGNYLRSRAGTQFDPHIVNTFLRSLKALEAEVELHGVGYPTDADGEKLISHEAGDAANYMEQIKRANQEVFSLYEMARDFGGSLDLDETLTLLTQKVQEFVPYDTCLVYLLDEGQETATAAHIEGRNSDILAGKVINVGEGATGYVLKKRKPVENVDPSLDFAFSHPGICDHYVGMASVPLLAEEKLIGAISVFSGKLAVYEEEHQRLLETISRMAADAISNAIRHAENETYALTDALTGLPNARSLQIQFEKELGRARRSGSSMQLLMLDLDGFKAVNDNLGHKAGDTMLKEIGRIIRAELRDYDFLARYGGDEFVALVPETDNSDVIELCSRIESAVASYAASLSGPNIAVGVSVGSACYPSQGESFEELLVAADEAMYRTKAFHKQRLAKLGEATATRAAEDEFVRVLEPVGILEEKNIRTEEAVADDDLVVELDESHIVSLNTIN